jgi:hypothetical protein
MKINEITERKIDEAVPVVPAAIWLIKFAASRAAWPVLKWVLKRHAGKLLAGGAAAYYIDQGWDWVISQIGEEYAQMLIDNKFTIAMAVALIVSAIAIKRFFEKKGDDLINKYQESISETATAGGTGAGAVALTTAGGNGFASGGIGTISRAGTVKKKKKPKKKKR